MTITLPGPYETLVPNCVYARETSTPKHIEAPGETFKGIFILKQYTIPTKDEVIIHVRQKARDVDSVASLIIVGEGEAQLEGKTNLERVLIALPAKVRRDVYNGHEVIDEVLRENTPAMKLPEGQAALHYFQVSYAVLPTSQIQEGAREISVAGIKWFDEIVQNEEYQKLRLGLRWSANLLMEQGALPAKKDLDLLLKHGVFVSRTLQMSTPIYDGSAVNAMLGIIYDNVPEANLAQVHDISPEMLEQQALPAVLGLHGFIRQQRAAQQHRQAQQEMLQRGQGLLKR